MKIISTGSGKDPLSPLDRSHVPLLLFDYDEPDKSTDVKLFYSVPAGELHVKRVAELRDHFYWTTPQGWMLLVHEDTRDTFLWNPLTRARVALPPKREALEELQQRPRCVLSHDPGHPDCVVLIADLDETVFWYCRPGAGGDRWLRHEYDDHAVSPDASLCDAMFSLTTVGGKFYIVCLLPGQFLVVALEFSPAGPEFTAMATNDAEHTPAGHSSTAFTAVESDGKLFLVAMYYVKNRDRMASKILVLKLDLLKRAKVEVMSTLGERSFLLAASSDFGASVRAKQVGLKENCIYFLKPDDKGLYVYDLGRGTTTIYNPGPDLEDDVKPELLVTPW
uniref:KIB1-4 beta-propeller domain-containing protein n=1 Tax=Oryza punctata TaxID=4537 RepID=A0A0E0M0R5_ORYPU